MNTMQGLRCMYPERGGVGAASVTVDDLMTVTPGQLINDSVLNYAIWTVRDRYLEDTKYVKSTPKIKFLPTYFFTRLAGVIDRVDKAAVSCFHTRESASMCTHYRGIIQKLCSGNESHSFGIGKMDKGRGHIQHGLYYGACSLQRSLDLSYHLPSRYVARSSHS